MDAINLLYLRALDELPEAQTAVMLNNLGNLIGNATPEQLIRFEIFLVLYKGNYKNDLQQIVNLRKASFPQSQQALLQQLLVIQKSKEDKYTWKYTLALAILAIMALLIAGTVVAKDSRQATQNFSNNAINAANTTASEKTNSTREPTSTSQKTITQSLSIQGSYSGWAALVIVVAFILWAYGIKGVFDGVIDRDIERLQRRQLQIQRSLI